MNAKITKKRLSNMLSYDWFKIIGIAAALIFAWMLVFSATATKIKPSQQFVAVNYKGVLSFRSEAYNNIEKLLKNDRFTHEILEVDLRDLSVDSSSINTLIEAYSYTNDLDAIFVADIGDEDTKYLTDENDKNSVAYERSYLQTFTRNYGYKLHNLSFDEGGYFYELEQYLNGYYSSGDYALGGELNTAQIEADFRARAKGDKRYKKEAQIQKGVEGEIRRVEQYRDALIAFKAYLNAGRVALVKTPYITEDGTDVYQGKDAFSINLCTNDDDSAKLSRYVAYSKDNKETALNMNICLFNSNGKENSYRYEGLVYVVEFLNEVYA